MKHTLNQFDSTEQKRDIELHVVHSLNLKLQAHHILDDDDVLIAHNFIVNGSTTYDNVQLLAICSNYNSACRSVYDCSTHYTLYYCKRYATNTLYTRQTLTLSFRKTL